MYNMGEIRKVRDEGDYRNKKSSTQTIIDIKNNPIIRKDMKGRG